jgi:hypothetical protein
MSFLSRLFSGGQPEAPVQQPIATEPEIAIPQTLVVEPKGQFLGEPLFGPNIRRGMWVVYRGYVGILRGVNREGIADVMLVHDDGTDLESMSALVTNLRQADYLEIPAPRRPGDVELAARLGYK